MSNNPWIPLVEPARVQSGKYDDVMAEFRANGRDSDTSSVNTSRTTPVSQSCVTSPSVQTQTVPTSPIPCSLCGGCPPTSNEFIPKDGMTTNANSQYGSNLEMIDIQNSFSNGLRKIVDKPVARPESPWAFLRRDFNQVGSPPNNIDNIWGNQYPRLNNLAGPITNLNLHLQRLQQFRQKKPGFIECVFCRNNGEQASFYRSHELKDQLGRVICPILRAFTCPCCGATGDNAHTIKYCPEKGSEFLTNIAQLKALKLASSKGRIDLQRNYDNQDMPWFNQDQLP